MTFDPILSLPYVACVLAGVAVVAGPVSFFWLNRRIQNVRKGPLVDPTLQNALAELSARVGQLSIRLEEAEQQKGPLSGWATEPASVNLNRRGQVLRLYRRGDSVAHIASALGLSTGEVALIVKVQEMIPGRKQQNPASEL